MLLLDDGELTLCLARALAEVIELTNCRAN